uniref:Uncharacterized protein n=1 Tax=Acrobeloides nanus TaxID=290746 RepID=A0A914CPR7_9BILA
MDATMMLSLMAPITKINGLMAIKDLAAMAAITKTVITLITKPIHQIITKMIKIIMITMMVAKILMGATIMLLLKIFIHNEILDPVIMPMVIDLWWWMVGTILVEETLGVGSQWPMDMVVCQGL